MERIKMKLIYPKWKKLPGQTTFNLPPHGPVAFAGTLPDYVDVSFTDENVEPIDFNEECDIVALSMMLSTQVKRGWEIAAGRLPRSITNVVSWSWQVASRRCSMPKRW